MEDVAEAVGLVRRPPFSSTRIQQDETNGATSLITPLVSETEWQACLSRLPAWDPPGGPVLIVAPHPDDETLGVGGLIARQRTRGVEVMVAAVTDGENCYADSPGMGEIRRIEQESALGRLGVESGKIVRLRLPDSAVSSKENGLVESLVELLSSETLIVAPWPGDFHPDHEACGRAAREAAHRACSSLAFYFFWTWHRGTTQLIESLPLSCLILDDGLLRTKKEALLNHRSQLARDCGDPILPEVLLAPARRPYEVFLVA
jgi:LmbE family N-acetylglucosaminyl deacetylase